MHMCKEVEWIELISRFNVSAESTDVTTIIITRTFSLLPEQPAQFLYVILNSKFLKNVEIISSLLPSSLTKVEVLLFYRKLLLSFLYWPKQCCSDCFIWSKRSFDWINLSSYSSMALNSLTCWPKYDMSNLQWWFIRWLAVRRGYR